MVLHRVTGAKRAETRSKRIVEIVRLAAVNERPFQRG
ncbi:MAG: YdeI/OmpD-associated family protein [Actinomycetota bacterium]